VQASGSGTDKVVGVFENGKSVPEFRSHEEDSKFLALLDMPDRKHLVQEQLEMHLASINEVVLPAAAASSSKAPLAHKCSLCSEHADCFTVNKELNVT
jgi:hypothetical protein